MTQGELRDDDDDDHEDEQDEGVLDAHTYSCVSQPLGSPWHMVPVLVLTLTTVFLAGLVLGYRLRRIT